MYQNENNNLAWKPSVKQSKFLSLPLTIKEALYGGAVMSGKSDVLLMYPIVHGWHNHPQFKGLFLRRTMPELRNEIIPRAKDYFTPLGAKYNKTDGIWTFPSGALFFMGHCENEDDVHDYDSMQPNYVAFDELTSFTEWQYVYITIERCRVDRNLEGVLPAIVRSGTNPGNIGHKFVYERFIKPFPAGGKVLLGRGGIKRVFIQATIDDNDYASKQYKQELDALPEAERRAKKYGDWLAFEGQVFDEFREKKFPGEPDNAIHVIPPFDIPSWWPRIVAIDWGFNAMFSVGFAAISPTKKIYVYRHLMFFGKKIEELAPEVKFWMDKDNPSDVVICHSANQHRGEPHTILELATEAFGRPIRLGEKNRIAGKMLLHEYLRWQQKPKLPDSELGKFDNETASWILRNKGLEDYKTYISSFNTSVASEDIPRLLFFDLPDVKVICEAIKACVYEKASRDGKKKEDVAEFSGDDPYDMLRMLLHSADSFFGTAVDENARLEKRNNVIQQFEQTKDMTAFYRNMRRIETENDEVIKPVSRYHRIH